MGCRVQGAGYRVQGRESRDEGLGCMYREIRGGDDLRDWNVFRAVERGVRCCRTGSGEGAGVQELTVGEEGGL